MFRTIAAATRITLAATFTIAALTVGTATATADPVTGPPSGTTITGMSTPPPSDPWD